VKRLGFIVAGRFLEIRIDTLDKWAALNDAALTRPAALRAVLERVTR